jgi:hypothetical protein
VFDSVSLSVSLTLSVSVSVCLFPSDVFLKRLHPALWEHLQLSMIQPQLYAISWARLLFGRVYVVTNSVLFRLWDYIFESTEGEGAVKGLCAEPIVEEANAGHLLKKLPLHLC